MNNTAAPQSQEEHSAAQDLHIPTEMHKMAFAYNWQGVTRRLHNHPHEASVFTSCEWMKHAASGGSFRCQEDQIFSQSLLTPLHIICNRPTPPLELLRLYFRICPAAVAFQTKPYSAVFNKNGHASPAASPQTENQIKKNKNTHHSKYNCLLPLHIALYRCQPLNISIFLARQDSQVLLRQDQYGYNVFHICARRKTSPGLLQALLDVAGPDSTQIGLTTFDPKRGKTPLQIACMPKSHISLQDFETLCQASMAIPSTITSTNDVEPPDKPRALPFLLDLCSSHQSFLTQALELNPPPQTPISSAEPSLLCNSKGKINLKRLWLWRPTDSFNLWDCLNRIFVLLRVQSQQETRVARNHNNNSNDDNFPYLHVCISQDPHCQTMLFSILLSLNPHYACQMAEIQIQSPDSDTTVNSITSVELPLHVAARHATGSEEWLGRIQSLMAIYPTGASIANSIGQTPLEILVTRKGVAWNHVFCILRENPMAITRLGLPEVWYPFFLAKLARGGQVQQTTTRRGATTSRLDILYTIICETPTLFHV